ncbi:hypothetical protein ES703_70418 [subsurface metagenome]
MNKDKEVILEFLDEIQADFDLIIQNICMLASRQKGIIGLLVDQWQKIIPLFAKIRKQVEDVNFNTAVDIGLSHRQLILKYKTYNAARDKFRDAIQDSDSLKERKTTKFTELARNLFNSMNTFLRSLSVNIPQVYAIKGFKEIIENIIN